jgi:toxin ParE1/3/4
VPTLRYSRRAEVDLLGIARYILRTWGEEQTVRYIDDVETGCQMLADNPTLGRACDHIRRGLHRMERGTHVVFYRKEARGILVSRILHRRVLPEQQPFDDDDKGSF